MAFITGLFFLAIGYLSLVPSELRAGRKNYQDVSGYLAADAGVVHALAWLEFKLANGEEPGVSLRDYKGAGKLDGGWSFTTRILPDRETAPRGDNPIRAYNIIAEAHHHEQPRRRVSVQVMQQSFSRYAMFMDNWPSNIIYNMGTRGVDGPLHTNDILRLHVPHSGYWREKGRDPMFMGQVTSSKVFHNASHGAAQDGMAYYRGNYRGNTEWKRPYNDEGPIAERYQRMVAGGRENLKAGVKTEELPSSSITMARAAWGFESKGKPRTKRGGNPHVVINEGGGIFINGDVDKMVLGESGGNSTVTINQKKMRFETTIVEVTSSPLRVPAGATLNGKKVRRSTTIPLDTTVRIQKKKNNKNVRYDTVKGVPNGVVYSNGDILDLSGVNKGRRTIAVEVEYDRKILIGGDLTLANTKPGSKPDNGDDALGLVGSDVMVSKEINRATTSTRNPLYIYAQVLAGRRGGIGGFGVENYNIGRARGYMEIYGGLVQSKLKPWAVLGRGGMSGRVVYNEHAGATPPPYFPSIPKFRIRAYMEEPIL